MWTVDDIPDLGSTTVLITGANTGLGFETARAMAAKGARVFVACRNPTKGAAAVARIAEAQPSARLEFVELDLADLASVRAAANSVRERTETLDILVNNAGLMALPFSRTADGFETQFGVNHLGHFALTGLLYPELLEHSAGRVVTVSSALHRRGRIDFDDLHAEHGYDRWKAYAQSKLANLLFCYELQRRLDAKGSQLQSVACHPGYANTQLQSRGSQVAGSRVFAGLWRFATATLSQPAEAGALPTLHAATAPDLSGGEYIGPGILNMWGAPKRVRSSRRSRDSDVAHRLWEASEAATDVRWPRGP